MRLAWIDRLRGVAILAVIWHHFTEYWFQPGAWLDKYGLLGFPAAWLTNGWLGVNLFFILSGFVLYLPYATGQRHLAGWSDAVSFCRHRASRLLPLYYFSTAVLLVFNFEPRSLREALIQPVALATVTFNFSKQTFLPAPNWVLWSLGLEVWFTFAFIAVGMLLPRLGARRVTIAVLALALAARLLGTYLPGVALSDSHLNPVRDSILGRLDDFLVGMLLAVWYSAGAAPIVAGRFASSLLLATGILLATIAAALWDTHLAGMAVAKWQVAIANNVFQAGIALVIVSCLARTAGSDGSSRMLTGLELIGMMCYSLYIWHGVVLVSVDHRLMPLLPGSTSMGYGVMRLLVYVSIIGPIAWLSYRFVEFGSVKDWRRLLPVSMRGSRGITVTADRVP